LIGTLSAKTRRRESTIFGQMTPRRRLLKDFGRTQALAPSALFMGERRLKRDDDGGDDDDDDKAG
jgi:hypothetical protein